MPAFSAFDAKEESLTTCKECGEAGGEIDLVEPPLAVGEVWRIIYEGVDCRKVDARDNARERWRENTIAVLRDKINIADLLPLLL